MSFYKRLIPSKEIRFKILSFLDFLPDKLMIQLQYFIKTGRFLNLKNPKRFTEKLQWYKLYYRDPLMTQCADKHHVRKYVAEKGLEDILIPQYGVYDNADDIDFDKLPNEFVLKTTNASRTNIICKDKNKLDIPKTRNLLNKWLYSRPVRLGREWAYYDIKPKIVCEQLLKSNKDNSGNLIDYKFLCFDGDIKSIWLEFDRDTDEPKRIIYDKYWSRSEVEARDLKKPEMMVSKPKEFKEMKNIATKLSQGFPHVRVDLYSVNGKVYFGELTFYSLSGYENFYPDEFDFFLGELFNIDEL